MYISQFIVLLAIPATLPAASVAAVSTSSCKLINPSAEGCGVRGNLDGDNSDDYYGDPLFAQPQITSSVEECARLCGRRRFDPSVQGGPDVKRCMSFAFDKSNGLCELGVLNVTEGHINPSETAKTVFFDISCFDCGEFCNQPYGLQLLDNAGFEQPLLGPWSASLLTLGKGHNSKHSVACVQSKYRDECELAQAVNMCLGELYLIQLDYKINATAPGANSLDPPYLSFEVGSLVPDHYPSSQKLSLNIKDDRTKPGLWRTKRIYFEPGVATSAISFTLFDFYYKTEISLDNVKLSRVKSPTQKPGVKSLLINGGFETGKFTPWMLFDKRKNIFIKSPGIHSSYGMVYQETYTSLFSMSQNVTTKPATPYLFSFDYIVPNATLTIKLLMSSKQEYFQFERTLSSGSSSFSAPFVPSTNRTYIAISFYVNTDKVQDNILDNFRFMEAEVDGGSV